ncbi:MAG: hypothetical protein FJ224_01250 [Lentisphaerae bacterium]|nr:hypothetical protein [Lentisphaerota bacterium]
MGAGKEDGAKRRSGARGCLLMLVLMLLLAAAGAFYVARTGWAKGWAARRISAIAGIELEIGAMSLAWPCDVVLSDVRSKAKLPGGEPELSAGELACGPVWMAQWPPVWSVSTGRVKLNLVRSETGQWSGGGLAVLGDMPLRSVVQLSMATRDFRGELVVHVEDMTIRWLDSRHFPLAFAEGVRFHMAPVQLTDEPGTLYKLGARRTIAPGGLETGRIEREWIATGGRDYVEVSRSGRHEPPQVYGFWEAQDR